MQGDPSCPSCRCLPEKVHTLKRPPVSDRSGVNAGGERPFPILHRCVWCGSQFTPAEARGA
jgi:hypothetical protein